MFALKAQRFSDGDRLEIGGWPVRLRVDGRARRISLRVDRAKSEIVALAPNLKRLNEAVAFAQEKSGWIAKQLAALPERMNLAPGGILRLNDVAYRLEVGPGRAKIDGERIVAPDDANWGLKIIRLAKREALAVLTERTAVHAAALNRPMPSVAVADPKARWGSCRPATPRTPAAIRYSWRLILAPAWVRRSTVAHELAHLLHMDHSPAFHAAHARIYGEDPRPARAWLKAHGAGLHRYQA